MNDNDFYRREFTCGASVVSRGELESLPCPFCTKDVTDEEMQEIIDTTVGNTRQRMGLNGNEALDLSDEKTDEVWWEELERAVVALDIPYYEDMDE